MMKIVIPDICRARDRQKRLLLAFMKNWRFIVPLSHFCLFANEVQFTSGLS